MKLLALDLGSITGYASGQDGQILKSDTRNWILKDKWFSNESFADFFNWLHPIVRNYDKVIVERPNSHMPGFHAVRVAFGMYGVLQAVCGGWRKEIIPVSATEVKLFWAGHGRAHKEDMVEACLKRGYMPKDHNEADARAIYTFYWEVLRGKADKQEQPEPDQED
jgi:Holliday junction resolvasome RuvABC endonuclease subunit